MFRPARITSMNRRLRIQRVQNTMVLMKRTVHRKHQMLECLRNIAEIVVDDHNNYVADYPELQEVHVPVYKLMLTRMRHLKRRIGLCPYQKL